MSIERGIVTHHDLMGFGYMTPLPGGVITGWTTTVDLPRGFHIIAVGNRQDTPHLWVVSGTTETAPAEFLVIADDIAGPDDAILSERRHVGSILPGTGGHHAWHVFELSRGDLA